MARPIIKKNHFRVKGKDLYIRVWNDGSVSYNKNDVPDWNLNQAYTHINIYHGPNSDNMPKLVGIYIDDDYVVFEIKPYKTSTSVSKTRVKLPREYLTNDSVRNESRSNRNNDDGDDSCGLCCLICCICKLVCEIIKCLWRCLTCCCRKHR